MVYKVSFNLDTYFSRISSPSETINGAYLITLLIQLKVWLELSRFLIIGPIPFPRFKPPSETNMKKIKVIKINELYLITLLVHLLQF
jgi:hypothetical protein